MKNKKIEEFIKENNIETFQECLNTNKCLNIQEDSCCNLKLSPKFLMTPPKNYQNLFLKKKRTRKNSDLNFQYNQSGSIKSEKNFSPYSTDTKITSYFQHKKASTESFNDRTIFGSNKKNKFELSPCAKKLNFENVSAESILLNDPDNITKESKSNENNQSFKEQNNDIQPNNYRQSKNWKFSKLKEDLKIDLICEYEDLKFSQIDKSADLQSNLTDKTKEILTKIKSKNFGTKYLNLNLQKIIKKTKDSQAVNRNKNLLDSVDQIINSHSIKDKYEELLNRELMLPCHYKLLHKKCIILDLVINDIKQSQSNQCVGLKEINEIFINKYKSNLSQEEFQQILFITPHFYIYKWEFNINLNDFEITIDIPVDINKRLEENYNDKSNFTQMQTFNFIPYKQIMSEEILNKRKTIFKKILLHLTNEHHKRFIKDGGISTKLIPFKHRTWHSGFDVHNVETIQMFKLISKPVLDKKYMKM